jgi:predicted membrane protein (TIGR00267 family)
LSQNKKKYYSKKTLLDSITKIYNHKLLQSKGFEILNKKAKDDRIKSLLERFCSEEKAHAEFWFKKIKELDKKKQLEHNFFKKLKNNFIFRILGPKGFFMWTIDGEMEAIHNFEIEIENSKDPMISHEWSRMASDERLHLQRMKNEFLGTETWSKKDGGGVRDMIFGVNDGLVSTLAFVVGAFAAFTDSRIVLISGIAELLAGTISMAVSSYQSTKSEVELLEKESQKQIGKKKIPSSQEKEKLVNYYQTKGFTLNEADAIVNRIQENKDVINQNRVLDQLGLSSEKVGNPIRSGILCGVSFGLAALIPIIPFALPLKSSDALLVSIFASFLALFGAGCMKTIFSRKKWMRSGLEMMIIGIGATVITYIIGTLFHIFV